MDSIDDCLRFCNEIQELERLREKTVTAYKELLTRRGSYKKMPKVLLLKMSSYLSFCQTKRLPLVHRNWNECLRVTIPSPITLQCSLELEINFNQSHDFNDSFFFVSDDREKFLAIYDLESTQTCGLMVMKHKSDSGRYNIFPWEKKNNQICPSENEPYPFNIKLPSLYDKDKSFYAKFNSFFGKCIGEDFYWVQNQKLHLNFNIRFATRFNSLEKVDKIVNLEITRHDQVVDIEKTMSFLVLQVRNDDVYGLHCYSFIVYDLKTWKVQSVHQVKNSLHIKKWSVNDTLLCFEDPSENKLMFYSLLYPQHFCILQKRFYLGSLAYFALTEKHLYLVPYKKLEKYVLSYTKTEKRKAVSS